MSELRTALEQAPAAGGADRRERGKGALSGGESDDNRGRPHDGTKRSAPGISDVADRVERELHADDICWDLQPLPEPAPMSPIDQVVETAIDALSYRLLVCEALDELRALTVKLDRVNAQNAALRERAQS